MVPRWLVLAGSATIAFHLLAVLVRVLSATSGPWPAGMGAEPYMPPQFAFTMNEELAGPYLRPLRLTHDFHFPSNRPASYGVHCEIVLKDAAGRELKKAMLPDPEANWWTRYRQELLVSALAADMPIPALGSEMLVETGQKQPTIELWQPSAQNPRHLHLRSVLRNEVERNQMFLMPSPRAKALAHSYVRHLCRLHGAASGDLIRRSKDPIQPAVLFGETPPPGALDPVIANFGEYRP
jgi:hypothetical protein